MWGTGPTLALPKPGLFSYPSKSLFLQLLWLGFLSLTTHRSLKNTPTFLPSPAPVRFSAHFQDGCLRSEHATVRIQVQELATESIPSALQVPQASGVTWTKISSTWDLSTWAPGLLASSASYPVGQLLCCGGMCLTHSGLQCFISESRAWGEGELHLLDVMLSETIYSSLKGGYKGPQQFSAPKCPLCRWRNQGSKW